METDLGDEQFLRISHFIEGHFGIRIPPEKRIMIQSRLLKRVRELKCATIDDYIKLVLSDSMPNEELSHMTDLVSTHMTSFFREPSHFELLKTKLLPSLCKEFNFTRSKPLIIWSAACSTGEEVWSLAMVLDQFQMEQQRARNNFEWAILGTDLSEGVLNTAKLAIYPTSAQDSIPLHMRQNYLMQSRSKDRHEIRIVPELRERVFFHTLNLMESPYKVDNSIHLIFCRNVLIYFDREHQLQVLQNLNSVLEPGGFLIVGHAESVVRMNLDVTQYASTVYQKRRHHDESQNTGFNR